VSLTDVISSSSVANTEATGLYIEEVPGIKEQFRIGLKKRLSTSGPEPSVVLNHGLNKIERYRYNQHKGTVALGSAVTR
jgi:hypothetical protein